MELRPSYKNHKILASWRRPAGIPSHGTRLVVLLSSLVLIPTVASGADETRLTGQDACDVSVTGMHTPISCGIFATATLDVMDCGGRSCGFVIESFSRGTADVPGYLAIETHAEVSTGTSASICVGPDPTSQTLGLPCTRTCTSWSIGTETTCRGTHAVVTELPRGGCTFASVLSTFGYNGDIGSAGVWHAWHVCRADDDNLIITPLW